MKVLIALAVLGVACGFFAYIAIDLWQLGPDPDEPHLLPFELMDPEAVIAVDNQRRACVLSATGHLPPRLFVVTGHSPIANRTAEDCP